MKTMARLISTLLSAVFLCAFGAPAAFCADIAGVVRSLPCQPVSGVTIKTVNGAGKTVGQAVTDSGGKYLITGINPGSYQYDIDASAQGYKNGSATLPLGAKGLALNWEVFRDRAAVAPATPSACAAMLGLSSGAIAALVVGGTAVVAGGVIGGVAAAGGFQGPAASPSL